LNYLVEEMDINPLLANIGFSAISTAINSTLQSFAPTGEKDIFKHIYETYEKNALTFLGAGDPRDPNYAWQQAAYIAQIQDFSTIIREQGLETALNTYATSFFNSTAVNAIVSTGVTIGEYFKTKWDAGQTEQVDLKNGKTAKGVKVEDTESILLFDDEGNIIGLKEGEELNFGDIGVDGEGKMGLLNGYLSGEYVPGLGFTMDMEGGYVTNAKIVNPLSGDTLYWVRPAGNGKHLYFDDYGDYVNYQIEDLLNDNYSIELDGIGLSSSFDVIFDAGLNPADYDLITETFGLTIDEIENMVTHLKYDGNEYTFEVDMPAGITMDIGDNSSLVSMFFGDIKETVTGTTMDGLSAIDRFSLSFRRVFTIFNGISDSAITWFSSSNIIPEVFDRAVDFAQSLPIKEFLVDVRDVVKAEIEDFASNIANMSEEEKLQKLDRLKNIADLIPSAPDLEEDAFDCFDNIGIMVVDAARKTEGYKEIVSQMSEREQVFHSLIWEVIKQLMDVKSRD